MKQINYDPKKDILPPDKFAPCTGNEGEMMMLPKDVTVKMISSEYDVIHLR